MARNVLDYRPAQDKAVAPSIAHVERSVGGGVVVRVAYPPEKFRDATVGVIAACCVLGLLPIPFLWFSERSFRGWGPFLPWMLFVGFVAWILIGRASRLAQAYTLQVDADGITIQRFRGRREWIERLPRERITDVQVGFGQAGRSRRSTSWLIIAVKPWYRVNRTLLHDLGGDQLARVADAVREGLGLEPVEWPSGRPRKTGPASPVEPRRPWWADAERRQALIFGVIFVVMGSVFAVNGGLDAWRAYRRLYRTHQTTCVLLDKRISQGAGEHMSGRHASSYYEAWTRVRYDDARGPHTVAGDLFPTNDTENGKSPSYVLQAMQVGSRYPLWIDDQDPTRVYLSRGNDSPWAYSCMVGGGTIFTLAGVACVLEGVFTRPRPAVRPAA